MQLGLQPDVPACPFARPADLCDRLLLFTGNCRTLCALCGGLLLCSECAEVLRSLTGHFGHMAVLRRRVVVVAYSSCRSRGPVCGWLPFYRFQVLVVTFADSVWRRPGCLCGLLKASSFTYVLGSCDPDVIYGSPCFAGSSGVFRSFHFGFDDFVHLPRFLLRSKAVVDCPLDCLSCYDLVVLASVRSHSDRHS